MIKKNKWLRSREDEASRQVDHLDNRFWKPLIDNSIERKILIEMKLLEEHDEGITFTKITRRLNSRGIAVSKETVKKKLLAWEELKLLESLKLDRTTYWNFI